MFRTRRVRLVPSEALIRVDMRTPPCAAALPRQRSVLAPGETPVHELLLVGRCGARRGSVRNVPESGTQPRAVEERSVMHYTCVACEQEFGDIELDGPARSRVVRDIYCRLLIY